MASRGKKTKGTLLLGLLLFVAGLIFVLAPSGAGVAEWLISLWPVFLICAGVVRVMGFAVERKPRSPMGGMLLILIGVLFLAGRFHSNLNALQIYGRYWLLLLGVFAGVELVRYYSHPNTEGAPPRLFTPWRLFIIALIVGTGVFANRVASNPSVLSALRLPGYLSGLRDSVVGQTYTFTDTPTVFSAVQPGYKVAVNNSYGNVKVVGGASVVRATLTKGVRAWGEQDARKVAEQIRLIVSQTADGVSITTNRHEINQEFTTDIQVEIPSSTDLSVTDSYGVVSVMGTEGDLVVKASYGRAEVAQVTGDVNIGLTYSDADASTIDGDIKITGAKRARVTGVTGAADLVANNGVVELRDISGPVRVDAPFSRITAQGLGDSSVFKTEHGAVKVARAVDVTVQAPYSDVRAENISGDLRVSSSNSDVQVRGVEGAVTIETEQSSVTAEEVRGPLDIQTSHADVVAKNFYDSARVRTSYRDVTLVPAGEPLADIEVENSHGEIKLVLPQASRFYLDAMSQGGVVKPVGFDGLPERGRDSVVAVLGSDGPKIRLKTSYKNITIQASATRQAQGNQAVN